MNARVAIASGRRATEELRQRRNDRHCQFSSALVRIRLYFSVCRLSVCLSVCILVCTFESPLKTRIGSMQGSLKSLPFHSQISIKGTRISFWLNLWKHELVTCSEKCKSPSEFGDLRNISWTNYATIQNIWEQCPQLVGIRDPMQR